MEFVCESKNGHHARCDVYRGPFPSGAPGIFIDQAAQLGSQSIFVGAVGDDPFGAVILDRLTLHSVATELIVRVPGVPTGSAFVSYNDDGSRDFVYNIAQSAASRFDASADVTEKLCSFGLDFMHVSGSALADPEMARKILTLCKATRATGAKISVDPNVRKELVSDPTYFRTLRELMSMASIFLPSNEDAALLFPGESLTTFARALCEKGIEYVILKRGDKGAEAISHDGEHVDIAAHEVEVLDPTGAG